MISVRPRAARRGRAPYNDMPNAISTSGTAAPPSRTNGWNTAGGIFTPLTSTRMPSNDARIIGLRNGCVTIARTEAEPREVTSSSVNAMGANTMSWTSSTGATQDALPST